ncbi:MAG TPA: ABC transporter permease [archaeon]|nr:ABC transporter permease [archaeon]
MTETEQVSGRALTGRKAELRHAYVLYKQNPVVVAGSIIAVGSIVLALLSGFIVDPNLWHLQRLDLRLCWNNPVFSWPVANIFNCSGATYPLGTDAYGRDLLQMIILALPLDMEISLTIVILGTLIGVALGSLAAYAGGKVDEVILRVTDVFFAIPGLVLAIVLMTILGRTILNLTIAVLITWWPFYVRLIRSQVLSEKERPYVEALRSTGASPIRILFLHILPNTIYPVIVQMTLDIGNVILTFSALMFLGFSPNPLLPELGNLVTDGINYVFTAPWLIVFPGLTIVIVVLGFNLLGDGIRDVLDPRLRR